MRRSFEDFVREASGGAQRASSSAASVPEVGSDPESIMVVPPSVFADTWDDRPREAVEIAFRTVSETVVEAAETSAFREGWEGHPKDERARVDFIETGLIFGILARACVRPDDRRETWFGRAPEDAIRRRLTPAGARLIWTRYELWCQLRSPLSPEASDEQVGAVLAMLGDGALQQIDAPRRRRVRILMHLIHNELAR